MSNRLPPPMSYAEFWERVRCLCALHDGSITSGFRTEQRNSHVGGHVQSRHKISRGGLAADVALDEPTAENRTDFASDAYLLGVHVYDEYAIGRGHLHLQATPPGQPNPGDLGQRFA